MLVRDLRGLLEGDVPVVVVGLVLVDVVGVLMLADVTVLGW